MTKLVRAQLVIFSILTVVGLTVMAVVYVNVPAMFGINRFAMTVQLAASGGLYPHANVSYRGIRVGEVESIRHSPDGVIAELSVESNYKIPVDSDAAVHSVSAIGEQYLELVPQSSDGPYLSEGSVIAVDRTSLPQEVGPMLDEADRLLASVADTKLHELLDETFAAFNGSGSELQSLLDSARLLVEEASANTDQTTVLIDQLGPLLDTQIETSDDIRSWTANLVRITDQLRESDPQLRSLVEDGPSALGTATELFQDLRPTLPLLLANLVSVGQVATIYDPAIEQILVLFPPMIAALVTSMRGPTEDGALVDFHIQLNDPPACTTGFLPYPEWRSPADLTVPDTPPNLFCSVPHDSPMAVRGARNTPCMEVPGKRAATVEACRSEEPYVPDGTNPPLSAPLPVQPSSFDQQSDDARIYTAARPYDPATGKYVGSDGRTYSQPALGSGGASMPPTTWETMMTEQQG